MTESKIDISQVNINDLDVLRNISIQTFIETFAHQNKEHDMRKYLSDYFNIEKLTKELNNLLTTDNNFNDLLYKFNSLDIDSIEFTSNKTLGCDDLLKFKYNIENIDKIIEFDGYYVIKYIANVEINGESIVKKFEDAELESKYGKKEKKWVNR